MEDGRALPAPVLFTYRILIECNQTTHRVPDCPRLLGLNVTDVMMFVPRETALTRMTTQRLGPSIQLLMILPLLHLLIPRTVLRSKKDVFVVLITENALDGPDPTPWKRAKFTSCEYSDGHLQCDFTNDCSEIGYSMVCCEDGGDCKGYTGPHPSDKWCS